MVIGLGHVDFAIAGVEGRDEEATGVARPVGEFGAGGGVLDLLPLFAVEADVVQALRIRRKDNFSALIIVGLPFIATKDSE